MSALDLLNPDSQTIGQAPYIPSTLGENISASFGDMLFRRRENIIPSLMLRDDYTERDDQIRQRLGVDDPFDLIDTTPIQEKYPNPTYEGRISMLNEKQGLLDDYIRQQREADPETWRGIKTRDEIEQSVKDVAIFARQEMEETQVRAGKATALAGGQIGGAGGAFTDLVNLATLPFGVAASMGVLRAMATEAAINMAIEAGQVPSVMEWQKELGFKYGFGEAATDVATAGVGGAAFTGIVRGAGSAIRAAGSKSMGIIDKFALNDRIPSEVRDAAKYQSRVAHIDETIPVERPVQREDIIVHREALEETQEAFNGYRQPDLQPANDKFNAAARTVEPPAPEPIPSVYIEKATEVKRQLEDIPDLDISRPSSLNKHLGYTPQSLTDFIKKSGGIQDEGGELAAMDIKLPGLIRKGKATEGTAQGVRTVDNSLDYVRQRATEAGYFPGKTDYNDVSNDELFEAIARDLSGKKVYKEDDLEAIARISENQNIAALYDQEGITRDMPIEQIAARLQEMDAPEPIPFDDILPDRNALQSMQVSSEAAASPEVRASYEADFSRLAKDNPDMTIMIDGNEVTMRDILNDFRENENVLKAIKTCAIG